MVDSLISHGNPTRNHVVASKWRILFAAFVAFGIVYNITFKFNEHITSARLAVLLLLVFVIFSNIKIQGRLDLKILLIFIPVPYVLVQWFFTGDSGQISRFFHLFLYSCVGGAVLAWYVGDVRTILRILFGIIVLQSFILLLSFFSLDYRNWLSGVVVTGANFDAFNLYRAPGFTSNAGSYLSVVQSLGVLCGGWLLMLTPRPLPMRTNLIVIAGMFICLLSCAVVGRAGLYHSIVFLMLSSFFNKNLKTTFVLGAIFFAFLMLFAYPILLNNLPSEVSVDWLLNWMLGFFSEDDQTFSALAAMPIASLDEIESWTGHGLVSLVDGSNPSGHDSGFIQAYYSMGFVFAGIFYCLYLFLLIRLLGWLPIGFKWILVLLFFLIEIKEPFLFKYTILFILVAVHSAFRSKMSIKII